MVVNGRLACGTLWDAMSAWLACCYVVWPYIFQTHVMEMMMKKPSDDLMMFFLSDCAGFG